MKLKLLLLTLCLTAFSLSVFAKIRPDSVGVENNNGKKVILHKLKPKDNYYSIGRRYHVSPKTIIAYNNNAKMTIGHVIKVPTDRPFKKTSEEKPKSAHAKKEKPVEEAPVEQPQVVQAPVVQPKQQQPKVQEAKPDEGVQTQYKVSAGETLYSIAKRFNTTVEDISNLNNLKSNTITPGQVLLVKSNASTPALPEQTPQQPAVQNQLAQPIVATRDSTLPDSSHHMNANKFGLFERDEKGVATWIDDEGLDPNKMLVLHRTAPIGTVIKITNIMTNRTTFAKVVGRFTDTEQTQDVIIVMTKNVAQALGALDKRFQVNLSYGAPTEQ